MKTLFYFVFLMLLCSVSIADVAYDSTVITTDQKFTKVRVVSISDDNVRIKAPYMREEGLALSYNQVLKIIFKGGKEDSKGIVLKSGLVLNGKVIEYLNGKWKLAIDGVNGELTLKDNQIASINFKDYALIVSKSGDENWKYHTSINIIEWIYANSNKVAFKHDVVPYSLEIEKLSLASNKLMIDAYIYSENFSSPEKGICHVGCIISDDKRNTYDAIYIKTGHIPTKAGKKKVLVECPVPKKNAENVTVYLTTSDNLNWHSNEDLSPTADRGFYPKGNIPVSDAHYCGQEKWEALPAFNMELLK